MRRTKEEALRTRCRIMTAALRTFSRCGIASTTLEQIAKVARVTRGAIYWHFSGKEALLRAIREDVCLPLMDQGDLTLLNEANDEPLDRVERFLLDLLRVVERNRRVRVAFSVMALKCEYVGAMKSELGSHARNHDRLRGVLARVYADAEARGTLRDGLTPRMAALETVAFVVGLMRLWLMDEAGAGMRREAASLVRAHVQSRRASTHDYENVLLPAPLAMERPAARLKN